jgi:hypothetical protein
MRQGYTRKDHRLLIVMLFSIAVDRCSVFTPSSLMCVSLVIEKNVHDRSIKGIYFRGPKNR